MDADSPDLQGLPQDRHNDAQALVRAISSYAPEFNQPLLLNAIAQARLDLPKAADGTILFGDPILLAKRLAAFRQKPETIIAGLLYASVKSDIQNAEAAVEGLRGIQDDYGPEIAGIVGHALELAHMHRPKLSENMLRKMAEDNKRFRRERFAAKEAERVGKKPDAVKPPLYEIWLSHYNEFLASLNLDPRAEAIRVAERDLLLDTVGSSNPSELDLLRTREAMEVQGPMALRLGIYQAYDRFGDLFLKTHHPAIYRLLAGALSIFRNTLGEGGAGDSVLSRLERRAEKLYAQQGLVRAKTYADFEKGEDAEGNKVHYYISVREKKPFSIWRKLVGDGIDPDELLDDNSFAAQSNPATRNLFVIRDIFQGRVYDGYGFRIIFHKGALLEKGLIEPCDKPAHEARNGCDYMRDVLTASLNDINAEGPLEGDFLYDPSRRKDYNRKPKPNGFRSLQEGFAVVLQLSGLGRFLLRVEGQFRSHAMHIQAEYGTAAHVGYKLNGLLVSKIWDAAKPKEQEHIFVFTPQGGILKLRKGATVADAAFAISRDLGVKCTGARISPGFETWHPFFNSWRYSRAAQMLLPGDTLPSGYTINIASDDTFKPTEPRLDELSGKVDTDLSHRLIDSLRPGRKKGCAEAARKEM